MLNMNKMLNLAVFLLPLALPSYIVRFSIGPLPTTLLEVFIILFIGIWFLSRGLNGLHNIWKTLDKWRWPIIAWLLATLVAVIVAVDHWGAFGHWRAFILEPIFVFIILMDLSTLGNRPRGDETEGVSTGEMRGGLMYGVAMVTIVMGVYAALQFATGWGIPAPWDIWPGRRATGTFGFPNGLSLFMAPFGVVCFMEWIRRVWDGGKQAPRLIFLASVAAAAVSVLMAKSMGGILAFGIGVTLVLIIQKQTRKIGLSLGILGLIGAAVVAVSIYRIELHPQNVESSVTTQKKWSSMVRTIIWDESWQVIKAHPLLGTGLRSYKSAVAPFHTATWMEIYPHPHNIILMLWIETGILGLLAFIWICITWGVVVLNHNRSDGHDGRDRSSLRLSTSTEHWIWLVPLVAILIHGMVDMPYFKNDLAMQFWILAALATFGKTEQSI